MQEIEEHPFVERNYGFSLANSNKPIKARVSAFTSSLEAALLLILSGQYIGFLPEYYARQWSDAGEIKPIMQKTLFIETQVAALVHTQPVNSLMTDTLLNIILKKFSNVN